MSTLTKQNTYFGVKKETTQGTVVNPTDTDFILIDDDFSTDFTYEEIERNVLNGNLDPLASLVGMQDSSIQVTVELKGSGTAHTAPEADALYKACFSDPTDPLSGGDEVLTGTPTVDHLQVGNTPGFTVGDIVGVDVDGAGSYEFAIITACSGTVTQELAISPDFSEAPSVGNTIKSGITYKPQESGHDFFSAHLFFDCDGQDGLWMAAGGCRANMALSNVSTGQIPKLQFTITPINWTPTASGSNLSTLGIDPTIDDSTQPPLCLGAAVSLSSSRTDLDTENLEMDLGLEITTLKAMTATSGKRSSKISKRVVTGKFDMDLEDATQYTAWAAQSSSVLLMAFGDTWGNRPVIIVPELVRNNVEMEDSDGIWKQGISWRANRSSTLGPAYIAFF